MNLGQKHSGWDWKLWEDQCQSGGVQGTHGPSWRGWLEETEAKEGTMIQKIFFICPLTI